ncbi:hypothetical protein OU995_11455 [Roseateles sp. SL47]|uniref:hypothetical protein n=1 Tax=Roseateles sp. SL47 TaxID=2995138 RepID=UPI00226DBD7D|nr:hypothetical protein [Roseateles sp. SL47]WAC75271.1 hypothetical protein OU995_11455 [Roseateles sp. SL47]
MHINVIPSNLLPETAQVPWGLVPDLGLSVAGPAGMDDLWRLGDLMVSQGMKLQATRMVYDRPYALERLACAYTKGDDTLRALAQDIFDTFQRRGEWMGLAH